MAEPLDMEAKINLGSPIRYASNQNAPLDPQANAQGSSQSVQNTLDEPVWETIVPFNLVSNPDHCHRKEI
jgi:hypothetical protein